MSRQVGGGGSGGKETARDGKVTKNGLLDTELIRSRMDKTLAGQKRMFMFGNEESSGWSGLYDGSTLLDFRGIIAGEMVFTQRSRSSQGPPHSVMCWSSWNDMVVNDETNYANILESTDIVCVGFALAPQQYIWKQGSTAGQVKHSGVPIQVSGMRNILNNGDGPIKYGDRVLWYPPSELLSEKIQNIYDRRATPGNKALGRIQSMPEVTDNTHPLVVYKLLKRQVGIAQGNAEVGQEVDILICRATI